MLAFLGTCVWTHMLVQCLLTRNYGIASLGSCVYLCLYRACTSCLRVWDHIYKIVIVVVEIFGCRSRETQVKSKGCGNTVCFQKDSNRVGDRDRF